MTRVLCETCGGTGELAADIHRDDNDQITWTVVACPECRRIGWAETVVPQSVERESRGYVSRVPTCPTCGGTGKEPICRECGGPNGTHDMSCGGFYAEDLPCPTCHNYDQPTHSKCVGCGVVIPATGRRGRPRVRCGPCALKHRRDYLRDKQRERRA